MENGKIRALADSRPLNRSIKKFETRAYVTLRPQAAPCAKFRANPSIGGFSGKGWKITEIFLGWIYLF